MTFHVRANFANHSACFNRAVGVNYKVIANIRQVRGGFFGF